MNWRDMEEEIARLQRELRLATKSMESAKQCIDSSQPVDIKGACWALDYGIGMVNGVNPANIVYTKFSKSESPLDRMLDDTGLDVD